MRFLSALFFCLLLCGLVTAQEDPSPYEIALERIRAVESSGSMELNLDGLGLSELPPEIANLLNIQTLYLGHNHLSSLPSEIGKLVNLEALLLNNNALTALPSELASLVNLRILLANNNNLTTLPSGLEALGNLCALDLSHNQLRVLPTNLSQLESLEKKGYCKGFPASLNLDNNPLISPPAEVLAQGTPAIMAYLRNEAWWHLQRLIIGGASAIGLVTLLVLGLLWKNRHGKQKRKVKELA